MIKTYGVHDHWTDIAKKNDVDIMSVDGVITGIKVNGEDYGGGGGSSDFSTAEVEFKNQTTTVLNISCCCIVDDNIESIPPLGAAKNKTFTAVLYKGSQQVVIPFGVELTTVTGDITLDSEEGIITINGSGTVLFQP